MVQKKVNILYNNSIYGFNQQFFYQFHKNWLLHAVDMCLDLFGCKMVFLLPHLIILRTIKFVQCYDDYLYLLSERGLMKKLATTKKHV